MGSLVVLTEITLDGVQENVHEFVFDYHDDETTRRYREITERADALLMGRITFEGFAEFWPTSTELEAERLNAMPKYVATRGGTDPSRWHNTRLLGDDPVGAVAELRSSGHDLLQYGTGELTRTLLAAGLVDELRYWVFPLVAGRGQRVFDVLSSARLELLGVTEISNGVVELRYRPLPGAGSAEAEHGRSVEQPAG